MALIVSLLRHAKSSREDPGLADFDRPLAPRGQRDGPRMAAWMRAEKIEPDVVCCSSSLRTRETLALVTSALPAGIEKRFDRALYHADQATLLSVIRKMSQARRHVLMVGHNPGFHDLAQALVGAGPTELRQSLREKFPSGGCAVVRFDVEAWTDIAPKTGTLTHWMAPKRLA